MNVKKRALSMLLVFAMVCSLIVFSSAESKAPGIHFVGPGDLSGGKGQVVGQETVLAYDTLTDSTSISVRFKIFFDSTAEFIAFASGRIKMTYDDTYLIFDGDRTPRVYINGVRNSVDYTVIMVDENINILTDIMDGVISDTWLDAEGCAFEMELFFLPTSASAIKSLDPNVGTKVNFTYLNDNSGEVDFFTFKRVAGVFQSDVWIGDGNLLPPISAVVTYAGSMVTYDVGDGIRSSENGGMDAFKPFVVAPGTTVTLADGAGLVISAEDSGDDIAKVFDYWQDDKGVRHDAGETFVVPTGFEGLPLIAVYADDKNGDGTADYKQMTVTYTIRSGDAGVLTTPTDTDNGDFTSDGDDRVIYVNEGAAIGDSIVELDLTAPGLEDWEFVGYFIDNEPYTETELENLIVADGVTVELRAKIDSNGNGIDDRDIVALEFYAPDGTTKLDTINVPDGTPYTIYGDAEKDTVADSGEAGEDGGNPTKVVLPELPNTPDGKFTGWDIQPIIDDESNVIGVEATPVFADEQPVEIPDLRDPEDPTKPLVPPVVDLTPGSEVIHRGIDGEPIGIPTIIVASEEPQVIEHPVPGKYSNLPKRDEDGNPFVGWILSDPETGDANQEIYYLDPYYDEPIKVTITDPKSEGTTADDEPLEGFDDADVPSDSTFEILDENGDVKDSGKIADENGTITLPATEDMPARNDDGGIFTGEWTVTPEVDPEDGTTNYVIAPEYLAPTEDDVVINVDEDDVANGSGLFVLKGAYASDTTATATFYLRIGNGPAVEKDAERLAVTREAVFGFENLSRPSVIFGELSEITYVGETMIEGVAYGEFSVDFETDKSGIVKLILKYGSVDVSGGYVVVTVADTTRDGKLNTSDLNANLRVINEKVTAPVKGEAGFYAYELMDNTRDSKLNTVDLNVLLRMVNDKVTSN